MRKLRRFLEYHWVVGEVHVRSALPQSGYATKPRVDPYMSGSECSGLPWVKNPNFPYPERVAYIKPRVCGERCALASAAGMIPPQAPHRMSCDCNGLRSALPRSGYATKPRVDPYMSGSECSGLPWVKNPNFPYPERVAYKKPRVCGERCELT